MRECFKLFLNHDLKLYVVGRRKTIFVNTRLSQESLGARLFARLLGHGNCLNEFYLHSNGILF